MLPRLARLSALVAAGSVLFAVDICSASGDSSAAPAATRRSVDAQQSGDTQQEISALLDQYTQALLKKDLAALDRIWADDLTFINLRGELLTKQNRLDNMKSGATAFKSIRLIGQADPHLRPDRGRDRPGLGRGPVLRTRRHRRLCGDERLGEAERPVAAGRRAHDADREVAVHAPGACVARNAVVPHSTEISIMFTRLLLPLLLVALATVDTRAAAGPDGDDDLTATVTAMARIGRAYGPVFSPDASRLTVISDLNGAPQLWIVPTTGGWPTLVTTGADPVGGVEWSPAGDWLAFTLLPGGGLNSQIYVVRPDGTGLRRLTDGGKENNWLSRWTWDGRHIVFSSNRRDPAAMDSWMVDVSSGTLTEVARNPGIGSVTSVSEDGRRMVLSRLRSRGDNNLYLIDRERGTDTLLTEHEPPALFDGEIARSGHTVYLSSNKDRDLFAFYRVPLGADGRPDAWELLAERPDAELDGFSVNEQETLASITWNVGGRTELELLDLRTRARTPVRLPSELADSGRFSQDGTRLALTVSGAARPPDVWVMDVGSRTLRQVTHSPHAGVNLDDLVRPEAGALHGSRRAVSSAAGSTGRRASAAPGPTSSASTAARKARSGRVSGGLPGAVVPGDRGVRPERPRLVAGSARTFVNLDNGPLRVERGAGTSRACAEYVVEAGIAAPEAPRHHGRLVWRLHDDGRADRVSRSCSPPARTSSASSTSRRSSSRPSHGWRRSRQSSMAIPRRRRTCWPASRRSTSSTTIKAPTMVLHGANDTNVPVVEAEQVVENLRSRKVPVEYVLFPTKGTAGARFRTAFAPRWRSPVSSRSTWRRRPRDRGKRRVGAPDAFAVRTSRRTSECEFREPFFLQI